MVKILQAYNFAKQQTYALNGDILAATLIGNNRIAISSAEQFIEIYDIAGKQQSQPQPQTLNQQQSEQQEYGTQEDQTGDAASPTPAIDERMPVRYTLATVGEVVQLIYCEAGKHGIYSYHIILELAIIPTSRQVPAHPGKGTGWQSGAFE